MKSCGVKYTIGDHTVFDNIKDAKKAGIKIPAGASVFLSESYFTALEECNLPGVTFRYVFTTRGEYYYFQVISISSSDLDHIINLDPYSKLLKASVQILNSLLFGVKKNKPHYLIVCGNMLVSGDYGRYIKQGSESLPGIIRDVVQQLEKSGKVIGMISKDYQFPADDLKKVFRKSGFNPFIMDPVMQMNIPKEWKSIDEYAAHLSAKYRLRYNNARKKLSGFQIKDFSSAEIKEFEDTIDTLYRSVQDKSPVQLIRPGADYFLKLAKHLKSNFHFRTYFKGDKMIAFLCGIKDGKHFEAHHIGIDYNYNKSHSIYLNILYEMLSMAIESGAGHISFGRTALEIKTTVGAVPINHLAFLKLNNRLVNGMISPFLPAAPPSDWIARNPFRQ